MKPLHVILLFTLATLFAAGCQNKTVVPFNHADIVYEGRINKTPKATVFYWSGTSAKIYVQGSGSVYALLKDEKGGDYYNIIIDSDSLRLLHPDTVKRYYLLVANLPEGKHSIEIFKRTEWDQGSTTFYGWKLEDNFYLFPFVFCHWPFVDWIIRHWSIDSLFIFRLFPTSSSVFIPNLTAANFGR